MTNIRNYFRELNHIMYKFYEKIEKNEANHIKIEDCEKISNLILKIKEELKISNKVSNEPIILLENAMLPYLEAIRVLTGHTKGKVIVKEEIVKLHHNVLIKIEHCEKKYTKVSLLNSFKILFRRISFA